jgi:hypothetical protein
MKKFLTSTLAVALFAMAAPSAQAATLAPTFSVTTNLTAACQVVAGPATVLDFGVYTAFVGAATPAPTAAIAIQCTRGLSTPTFAFDTGTGYGVIAGLNYNVTAGSAITTAGTAATAVAGGVGTADVRTITLTGAMAALQAGACAGVTAAACAGAQSVTRTLTITY